PRGGAFNTVAGACSDRRQRVHARNAASVKAALPDAGSYDGPMTALRCFLLPLLVLLGACTCLPSPPAAKSLLLVSLDGVHPDFLGRGDTPHLDRLADEGVRAA